MLIDLFLLRLDSHYCGNPYYVTGHALASALRLGREFSEEQKKQMQVSHGIFKVFVGSQTNEPDAPRTYDEFFQTWRTLARVPVDLVVPEYRTVLRKQSPPILLASPFRYSKRLDPAKEQRQFSTFLSFYVGGLGGIDPNLFDRIQVGGRRNQGMGLTRLHHHIQTDTASWFGWPDAQPLGVRFITPLCLSSTFAGTDAFAFPSFLEPHQSGRFRQREEDLNMHGQACMLSLCDSGQAFALKSDASPRHTCELGISRIGVHKKYGYGEFQVFKYSSKK